MAAKHFTLAVIVVLASMALGQENTKGDTDGSGQGPEFELKGEIVGGPSSVDAALQLQAAVVGGLQSSGTVATGFLSASAPQPEVNIPGGEGGVGAWVKNVVGDFFKSEVQAWHDNYTGNHVAVGVNNVQTSLRRMQNDPVGAAIAMAIGSAGSARVGPNDLVFGLSYAEHPTIAGEQDLSKPLLYPFRRNVLGGQGSTIGDLLAHGSPSGDLFEFTKSKLDEMSANGGRLHFNLDGIRFPEAMIKENWRYGGSQTGRELQYVQANWFGKFGPHNITFYRDNAPLPPEFNPW